MALNNAMSCNNMKTQKPHVRKLHLETAFVVKQKKRIFSDTYLIQIGSFTWNVRFWPESPLMVSGPKHNYLLLDIFFWFWTHRVLFIHKEEEKKCKEKEEENN